MFVCVYVQWKWYLQQVQTVQQVQRGQRGQLLPFLLKVHALLLLQVDHQHPVASVVVVCKYWLIFIYWTWHGEWGTEFQNGLTGGPANPGPPAGPTSPRSPCGQQAVGSKRLFKLKDGSLCFARFCYEIFKRKCKLVEQGVISSYSQRVHEVQLGRQVRRNHPHPGGENRKHFISLQLFQASTDLSRSLMWEYTSICHIL